MLVLPERLAIRRATDLQCRFAPSFFDLSQHNPCRFAPYHHLSTLLINLGTEILTPLAGLSVRRDFTRHFQMLARFGEKAQVFVHEGQSEMTCVAFGC